MSDEMLEKIRSFVADTCAVNKASLSGSTSLLRDLGIDGDDAIEFIEEFSKTFDVDMSGFITKRHFGPEGFNPIRGIFCLLFSHKKSKLIPIRLCDLAEAAKNKKWASKE